MTVAPIEFAVFEGTHAVHKTSTLLSPKFAQVGVGTITLTDNNGSLDLGGASLAGSALPAGDILVGNASSVATATALSGDATLSASGVLTIAAGSVSTAKLADGAVTKAKLDDSVAGKGLQRSGSTKQIEVNVDSTSLTITNGVVMVASGGVDTPQLANEAVTVLKLSPGLQTELSNHENRIVTLESEVATLITAVSAIQSNVPIQYVTTSVAGQTQIAVSGFSFSTDNAVLDIEMRIDGRVQTQDTSGGTTESFFKVNATTLQVVSALPAGKEIVVLRRGTVSGPAVTQVIGSADLTNISVPVAPSVSGGEALGQPAKAWSSLYLKDSASAQIYQLIFVNNQLQINPL